MRQSLEPLAQQAINPLHQLGIGAGFDAVVERLELHLALGKLALEVLVPLMQSFAL